MLTELVEVVKQRNYFRDFRTYLERLWKLRRFESFRQTSVVPYAFKSGLESHHFLFHQQKRSRRISPRHIWESCKLQKSAFLRYFTGSTTLRDVAIFQTYRLVARKYRARRDVGVVVLQIKIRHLP